MSLILLFYVSNLLFYVYNTHIVYWKYFRKEILIAAKRKKLLLSQKNRLYKVNTNVSFCFFLKQQQQNYATLQETAM